jgi:NitT/TauT family transport system permease protein
MSMATPRHAAGSEVRADALEPDEADEYTAPGGRWRFRALVLTVQVVFIVVVVAAWQLSARQGWVDRLFTSDPSDIVTKFWTALNAGGLWGALGTTLYETLVGFAVAVALGTLTGVALYLSPVLRSAAQPFIAAANSLPRLALAPLFVIWFGVGSMPHIILVITVVYFIIVINTSAALQNCSRDHLLLAKTLGVSKYQLFTKFMIPSAAPTLFAGYQLGMSYAFLSAVIAEIITGGSGLGADISVYQTQYNTTYLFDDLILMCIVASLLSGLMTLAERRVLAWRQLEFRGVEAVS